MRYLVPFHALAMLAAPAIVLGASSPARASESDSAEGVAEVQIGFGLTNVESLDFGAIALGPTGGAVTINAATGAVSSVGDVTLYSTRHRARYTLDAPVGQLMLLYIDPTVTLTRVTGTETMTASLTHSGGAGTIPDLFMFLPIALRTTAASQVLYAGGTLTIPAGQAEGTYEGEFDLIVTYL